MTRWVYAFGGEKTAGGAEMNALLGGKGANLAEMARLGLPVPPGFTITTEVCTRFYEDGECYPAGLEEQVEAALAVVEAAVDRQFGGEDEPLLLSVRSGARVSMPGMMDTVLNLGLNDRTVEALAVSAGDRRFAFDSYRRFVQMFADVALGVDRGLFEEEIEHLKDRKGVDADADLNAEDWRALTTRFKEIVLTETGVPFPDEPHAQLWEAIGAVMRSWQTPRARTYRRLHDIPEVWGTAVNVQAMVFGNMGEDCATGVAFTRNPSTGENALYGEYLVNAQGEDVVAGIRTPQSLTVADAQARGSQQSPMERAMPEAFARLMEMRAQLECHFRDMQDIEFTVETGRLWMLQTRSGKRTAQAALQIAVDMVEEGTIGPEEAVMRIEPQALEQLLHPTLDPDAERDVIARGLPASPGAASGRIVFTADAAEQAAAADEAVILVRSETSPEDIHGMHAARGILTSRGGMTSHAAVVARGMGRACVSGAGAVRIDAESGVMLAGGRCFTTADRITIDGGTGEVMAGEIATIQPEVTGGFAQLMEWADEARLLRVRANAETPRDAEAARAFGAEGIGLCRTEHMFFDADRILAMREMILADDETGRRTALAKLLPMQRRDFVALFRIMDGLPVTIRLLDPPLHEFLPRTEEETAEVAAAAGVDAVKLRRRALRLEEENPMLGHRGCRLGVTWPEIYEMQARAIFEAAAETGAEPEVMVPLVATGSELEYIKAIIDRTAASVVEETSTALAYSIGTMIELPRAALRAAEIAPAAAFFSFGTNDLTQTAFGISRDDASSFLGAYRDGGILANDPFETLDIDGVGELVRLAAERGRAARPDLKLGICGEHGGDPASVVFCHDIGLDYVSCSPYRVPIARLAAAQAAISLGKGKKQDQAPPAP
ncbi:MAG: pyruvate, phosphate dikinase [Alphaproteobacteria bacterium]|nr:pyruvate, phosphate dikinase [Alphaproteobacteria bacterium]